MEQLVRTTIELEQFECEKCGRMVYIPKMDLEAEIKEKGNNEVIPDCPYNCWSETKHRRTLIVEVRKVIECLDKSEIYVKELKKPDDIIEVHKTLENLFGE